MLASNKSYSLLLLDLLYLLPLDESDFLGDDYEDDESDSGSSSTYSFLKFSLLLEDSVGRVSGWGLAFLHQQESSPNVIFFCLSCSYQKESNSKVFDS